VKAVALLLAGAMALPPPESPPAAAAARSAPQMNDPPASVFHPRGLIELAGDALAGGDAARAAELARLAAELPVEDHEDLLDLAELAIECGRIEQGQRMLRKAALQEPGDPRGHALSAAALRAKGNFKGALAAAQRALDLAPDSAVGHAARAATLAARGQRDVAAESFRRALASDPEHRPALRGLIALLRDRRAPPPGNDFELLEEGREAILRDVALAEDASRLMIATGRGTQARALLEELLLRHPTRHHARLLLARTTDDPLEALAEIDIIRRQAQASAQALAVLALEEDDPELLLARAHRLAPEQGAISRQLVRARLQKGNLEGARRVLARSDTLSLEQAELLISAGAFDAASDLLRAIDATLDEVARRRVARAFANAGGEGARILDSLVVAWPSSAAALAARAALRGRADQWPGACADLRAALERFRGDCELNARLMAALRHDDDPQAAWRVARASSPFACAQPGYRHQSALTALAVGDSSAADTLWWGLGTDPRLALADRSNALLDLARLRRRRGELDAALAAARRAFALAPARARTALELARVHLALGMADPARRRAAPWVDDPLHGDAAKKLLESADAVAGNRVAEEAQLRAAFDQGDRSIEVRCGLAELLLHRGDPAAALEVLGTQRPGADRPDRLLRAFAHARDQAFASSPRGSLERSEVISSWRAYLAEGRPNDHQAYRRLAAHLAATGSPQSAALLLERAPGAVEAADLVAMAEHRARAAQPERANALLDSAATSFPADHRIALARARIRASSGRWEEASPLYQLAAESNPGDIALRFRCVEGLLAIEAEIEAVQVLAPALTSDAPLRAHLLLARAVGDPATAQRILTRELSHATRDELRSIATTALSIGAPVIAAEAYDRAKLADPDDPLPQVGLAIARSRVGADDAPLMLRACAELPGLPASLTLKLASEWLRRGAPEQALPLATRAAQAEPSALALRELGQALLRLQRYEVAIRHLRESLRYDARDARGHLALAEALLGLGDQAAARPHLVRATRLDPRSGTQARAIALASGNLRP